MGQNEFIEEYAEIDLIELMWEIIERWWLVVGLTLLAAVISFSISQYAITPVYTANSTIFIGKDSSNALGINLNDLTLDNKLVTDYKELLNTRLISERVIKELGLKVSSTKLASSLKVQTIKDSRFMKVSFTDKNPMLAQTIVNKYSDVLKEKAESVVGVKNVQVVDYAIIPEKPSAPSVWKNTGIAALVGFIAAIGIILLNMLLNNTVQKDEDLEKHLGLPVLGVIPKFKGESR